MWRDLALLLAACLGLWAWTMGMWDLWGPDETRYVQVAKELLERSDHNWLLLTVNYEPYGQKPPLPFWAFAAMLELTRRVVSTWTVRIPSVFMGTLAVLLTYLLSRRRFGRPVGWLAAWLLVTSPLFCVETATARLDVIFTGFVMISMWAWLARRPGEPLTRARVLLYWLGFLGGFFTKGPPVLLIALVPLAWEAWRARGARPLREVRLAAGLAATVALVGGWLWWQTHTAPAGFVEHQIESATLERLVNPRLHNRPPWYYLESLLSDGFTPWALFLGAGLIHLWRRRREPLAEWPVLRPLLAWLLPLFVFFSIIPGKREQYLLPMFPAMAILTAWYFETALRGRAVFAWVRRLLTVVARALGLGMPGAAVFFARRADVAQKLAMDLRPIHLAVWVAYGLFLAGTAWAWRRARTWGDAFRLVIICMYLGELGVFVAINPVINRAKSFRIMSQTIDRHLTGGPRVVGALGDTMKPELQVYGHYRMVDMDSNPAILSRQAAALPPVIISEPKQWKKAAPALEPLGYKPVFEGSRRQDYVGVYVRPVPTAPADGTRK
ncbi:MAG: glycosyltransferase family 39 protein [bacterium]|nr:glycosyltransferase family 39 protein [bacterium]